MVTAAEIVEYDTEELETRLTETRKELFNLRFQLATGQLDSFTRIGQVKKDVARMLTELRAREIAEAEGLAEEAIPAHVAAARQRAEDAALGRTRTTASERRAAARAEAESESDHDHDHDHGDHDHEADEADEVEDTPVADVDSDAADDEEEKA
jgi:large subunit ribosomal protein L29